MAKIKYPGAGGKVEVDVDGMPTWTDVGCTFSITPPPEVLADVNVQCQQETSASPVPGLEELSQFQFVEPMDYAFSQTIIDDMYAARESKLWRITFTRGSDTQVMQFSGYVSGKVPAAAGGNDVVQRTVTVTRDGPITWNPGP